MLNFARGAPVSAVNRFRVSPVTLYSAPLNSDPPNGSATMAVAAVIKVLRDPGSGVFEGIVGHGFTAGWVIDWNFGAFNFVIEDGGGTSRALVSTYSLEDGQLLALIATYNETTQALNINGYEDTAGPFVGYTPNGLVPFLVGSTDVAGTLAGPSFAMVAIQATDSAALSAGQRASHSAQILEDIRQGRPLSNFPTGAPERYWDARDIDFIGGTWDDRIASARLNATGSPERFEFEGRLG